MSKINYPVMIVTKKYIHGQYNNLKSLSVKTIGSYKSGIYRDMIIIDSLGYKYRVIDYRKKFKFSIFLYNIVTAMLDLFMRPFEDYSTWIDFDLSELEKLSFDELKKEVASIVNSHPSWYVKKHEAYKSIEDKLASYSSIEDMISKMAGYP